MKYVMLISFLCFITLEAALVEQTVWMKTKYICNFPPSLWCSSLQIAESCQVVDQCRHTVWQKGNAGIGITDDRVQFALYYETLCPDCQVFMANQLWPTFKKIGEIINLDLIPYGNAKEEWDGNQWQFTCQHGAKECYGNLIHTCSIHVTGSVNASFPFIACLESTQEIDSCAKKHGIDMSAVTTCVNGPDGNKLEHEMAVKTDSLNPPHQYVPWVTLNGVHTEDIAERAETDLLGLICDAYQGSKVPAACKRTHLHACTKS